jgi:16S rRNA (uracil1498-N3)-methyltransferase
MSRPASKASPAASRKRRRIFLPVAIGCEIGASFPLSANQKRHLITTLRHGAGDEVEWFDGAGGLGVGTLRGSERTTFALEISTREEQAIESADRCVLLIALPRRESIHQCIELATIAGVGSIQLFQAAHSAWKVAAGGREAVIEKATAIAIEASEQSGRLTVPPVTWLKSSPQAVEGIPGMVACTAEETTHALNRIEFPNPASPIHLAIGPEGGWNADELTQFWASGWVAWHLPGATLTTVAACAILPSLWRFGNARCDSHET